MNYYRKKIKTKFNIRIDLKLQLPCLLYKEK